MPATTPALMTAAMRWGVITKALNRTLPIGFYRMSQHVHGSGTLRQRRTSSMVERLESLARRPVWLRVQ